MPHLPRDIAQIIIDYAGESWDLLPWIELRDEIWDSLASNPRAIEILLANQDKISAVYFVDNPAAEDIIRTFIRVTSSKLPWANTLIEQKLKDFDLRCDHLCSNPAFAQNIAELARINHEHVDWGRLSENPNPIAIRTLQYREECVRQHEIRNRHIFSSNPEMRAMQLNPTVRQSICRLRFSKNLSAPIEMLREFLPDCSWHYLSMNPAARPILLENPDKIDPESVCANPAMMDLILDGRPISWAYLSGNPAAIAHLEANKDKIVWAEIGGNIAIFRPRVDPAALLDLLTADL
jgi:hypothetical protein